MESSQRQPFDVAELRLAILDAILSATNPAAAVTNAVVPNGFAPGAIIASGKASVPMVEAALDRFGDSIRSGVITSIPAHTDRLRTTCARYPGIEVHPADHPLPTEHNIRAAHAIAEFADKVSRARTNTLVLISGGASAHLTAPAPPLTLDDLRATTDALLRSGATIHQLNTVRKHCELLKGGRLAERIAPARAHVMVLSDVIGDPLHTIGSGPTAPDPTSFADAAAVLEAVPRAGASTSLGIPDPVRQHIAEARDETPKPGDPCFAGITHNVILNNTSVKTAVEAELARLSIPLVESRGGVEGEAADVAADLVRILASAEPPAAVVFAGETTVTVGDAPGRGGRNQELALAAAIQIESLPNSAVLTFATDGIDGPTDAAGAFVTAGSAGEMRALGIDPVAVLARHDSHAALDAIGALIRTGPTGTNVNDIAVALRW